MLGITLPEVVEDGDTFEANAKSRRNRLARLQDFLPLQTTAVFVLITLTVHGYLFGSFANIEVHNGVNVDNEKCRR